MARRGVNGQLNMFDFIKSLEADPTGEVEMVSLMPLEELEVAEELIEAEEPQVDEESIVSEEAPQVMAEKPAVIKEKPKKVEMEPVKVIVTQEVPVMSRSYELDGVHVEIAYLKYNKVRIQRGDAEPEIKIFGSSKEAVDYYVEQMQELETDE